MQLLSYLVGRPSRPPARRGKRRGVPGGRPRRDRGPPDPGHLRGLHGLPDAAAPARSRPSWVSTPAWPRPRVSLRRVRQVMDAPPEVAEAPSAVALAHGAGRRGVRGRDLRASIAARRCSTSVSFRVAAGRGPRRRGAERQRQVHDRRPPAAPVRSRARARCASTATISGALRLADLRRHVALVEQAPFLFHATHRREPALRAARGHRRGRARGGRGRGPRRPLARLPEGLRDRGGRAGARRSPRASGSASPSPARFSRDPAVLVLDEPTAALDPETERQVLAGYEALMRGRTTIVISHRPALAERADRVVVLDGARVVESGPARRAPAPAAGPSPPSSHGRERFAPGRPRGRGGRVASPSSTRASTRAIRTSGGVAGGVGFDAEGRAHRRLRGPAGPRHGGGRGHSREGARSPSSTPSRSSTASCAPTSRSSSAGLDWAIARRFPLVNLSLGTAEAAHEAAPRRPGRAGRGRGRAHRHRGSAEDGRPTCPGPCPGSCPSSWTGTARATRSRVAERARTDAGSAAPRATRDPSRASRRAQPQGPELRGGERDGLPGARARGRRAADRPGGAASPLEGLEGEQARRRRFQHESRAGAQQPPLQADVALLARAPGRPARGAPRALRRVADHAAARSPERRSAGGAPPAFSRSRPKSSRARSG